MKVRFPSLRLVERRPPRDAAAWMARIQSGAVTKEEAAAFDAWLMASPQNRRAYEQLSGVMLDLEGLQSHPEILAMREEVRPPVWPRRAAAAAMVSLVLGSVATFGILELRSSASLAPPPMLAAFYETPAAQTSSVTLSDGSEMLLDASSTARVRMDGRTRRVELLRGRAYFSVAKDRAHPFIVSAGGRAITALGTKFDVNLLEHSVEVVLAEGRVEVRPNAGAIDPASAVTMSPGYRLVATGGQWTLAPVDLAAEARWRSGVLVFDEARLGDIVAEVNRYVTAKVVIATPRLADQRMSAVLKAGDVGPLLSAVGAIGVARWRPIGTHGYELLEMEKQTF